MKKLLLIFTSILFFTLQVKDVNSIKFNMNTVYTIDEITVTTGNPNKEWELLIKKIIFVESSNGKNLVGDSGNAIGHLQIWPIMVDEVNRILGKKVYSNKDRWNKEKSIEMFNIYQEYWNPDKDPEIAASIWNRGPKGKYNTNNDYVKKVNSINLNLIT